MKILVTGGAGFIGSFIVDELVKRGHDATVFDNLDSQVHSNSKLPEYFNKKAKFIKGDVRNYDAFKSAVLDTDIIFHEASSIGVGQSQYEIKKYVDVNIGGTANLLNILVNEKHRVKKLLVAASMSSYGEGKYECNECGIVRPELRTEDSTDWEPKCPSCKGNIKPVPTDEDARQDCNSIYALSKKAQEDMCIMIGKAYNISAVGLRYFNVYGPRQSLSNPYTGVAAIFMSRIKNTLGWEPKVSFEDGMRELIKWSRTAKSMDRFEEAVEELKEKGLV